MDTVAADAPLGDLLDAPLDDPFSDPLEDPAAFIAETSMVTAKKPRKVRTVTPKTPKPARTAAKQPRATKPARTTSTRTSRTASSRTASSRTASGQRRSLVPLLLIVALVVAAAAAMWLLVFRGGGDDVVTDPVGGALVEADATPSDADSTVENAGEIPVIPEEALASATDDAAMPDASTSEDVIPDVAPESAGETEPSDVNDPFDVTVVDPAASDEPVAQPEPVVVAPAVEEPVVEEPVVEEPVVEEPVVEEPVVEEPVVEEPAVEEPVAAPAPSDGRVVEIAPRIEPCKFGSRCLVAGFSLSGFQTQPDSFICEFANGSRYTFPLKRTEVDYACATSGSGDSITIEIDGVRSETVVLD